MFSELKVFKVALKAWPLLKCLEVSHLTLPLLLYITILVCRISYGENSAITYTMWYGVVSASTHLFVLLVTTQLPGANGYTGGKVVFVDTEV